MKHYQAKQKDLEAFKAQVENGEFDCANQRCSNTATQVITITRTFALFTQVVDVPVCDEHTDFYY